MKTSYLLKIFLLCLSFGFFACSDDENPGGGEGPVSEIPFTKRLLIEDYTGTWCGNCPNVAYAIEQVKLQSENVVAVGIHRASSDTNNPNYDPFNYEAAVELEQTYGVAGYPWAMLDRTTQWAFPAPLNVDQAVELTKSDATVGLAFDSALENNTLNVTLNIKFGTDFTQNLSVVVYVLESGLIADQTNYTTYYEGEDILVDFEYNHVLRASLTNLLGDAIPAAETNLGNIYTTNFSVPVADLSVTNTSNIHLVGFVTNENGTALNARKAAVSEAQAFVVQ